MAELTRETVATASWDDLFAFMDEKPEAEIAAFKKASTKMAKDSEGKETVAKNKDGRPVYDLQKARAFIKKTYFAITSPDAWFSKH